VGTLARIITVKMDEKGRVRIPAAIQRELKSRRFTLSFQEGKLLIEPMKSPETAKGRYKCLLKTSLEKIEEAQERFSSAGRG